MPITTLLWIILVLVAATAVLSLLAFIRAGAGAGDARQVQDELRAGREESSRAARDLREEVGRSLRETSESIARTLESLAKAQNLELEAMSKQISGLTESNQSALERIRQTFTAGTKDFQDGNDKRLVEIRSTLDSRVKELQESNERKLEEMRKTVDEKLHDTLEKRLGESFKFVSERLEAVQRGLGEMQTLANGVGDLKRVLTNVKSRGTWAEFQLGALLEQTMTAEQFGRNIEVKPGSGERVEFAIRLPGSKNDPTRPIWLPIDSKFPQEDYLRLQEAADRADPDAVKEATDALMRAVKLAAKGISAKYVCPPHSVEFGVMYLATEGIYSEVVKQQAVVEELQNKHRILIAGPTNLVALLTCLRMGFQTLAIEQRASEVWRVLGAVKAEFGKFGEVLDKVKKQLGTASQTLEDTGRRTRAIERELRGVEKLPELEVKQLLALPGMGADAEDTDSRRPNPATAQADA